MKRLLLCGFLLLPTLSQAASDWFAVDQKYGKMYAVLYTDGYSDVRVGFEVPAPECLAFSRELKLVSNAKINGQLVKIQSQCVNEGLIMYFAQTSSGAKYIIDQFKESNTVHLVDRSGSTSFDASGFTAAYNKAVDWYGGDAL